MKKPGYFNRFAGTIVALGLIGLASPGIAVDMQVKPGAVKPAAGQMKQLVVVEVENRILTVGASTNLEARVVPKAGIKTPLKNVPVIFQLGKLGRKGSVPLKSSIERNTGETGVASLPIHDYADYAWMPGTYPITVEFNGKPGDNSYASATGSGTLTVIKPATKITGFKCYVQTQDPYETGGSWQSNYVCTIEASAAGLPLTELMKKGYLDTAQPPKASVEWTIPGVGTKTATVKLVEMKNGSPVAGTVKTHNESCADTGSFSVTIKAHVIGDDLLQPSEDNQTSFPHTNDWCKGKHN